MSWLLAPHRALAPHSQLAVAREGSLSGLQLALLLLAGATAGTLGALVDFNLGIPGHSIVLHVVPLILGLSLAPRNGAGTVMGAAAGGSAGALFLAGQNGMGPGAWTSLLLAGPLLDLALSRARSRTTVTLACITAATLANALAFTARAAARLQGGRGRSLARWASEAWLTYLLCGIAAGLLAALLFSRKR